MLRSATIFETFFALDITTTAAFILICSAERRFTAAFEEDEREDERIRKRRRERMIRERMSERRRERMSERRRERMRGGEIG